MAKLSLIGLAMCCLLVAAHAASFNCDDARRIGIPKKNQCGALCTEVVRQTPALKNLSGFCKNQCQQCVVAVSKCRKGAKQPMPKVCAQAFRIPAVMKVVNQYMSRTRGL
ncbi:hypothetical protein COO60DRAFT_1514978 [Scenedesmus sp. NREL 46B-D3]|nr:hypothetical protein COO60DRAFT_1514978 [Scenedesmus sp. NREL 46B-D3]